MAENDIQQEMDKLRADIATLRSDVASLIETLKQSGAQARERVYHRAGETTERLKEQAIAAEEAFELVVGERPIASLLTAFGTGLLVGKLLERH